VCVKTQNSQKDTTAQMDTIGVCDTKAMIGSADRLMQLKVNKGEGLFVRIPLISSGSLIK